MKTSPKFREAVETAREKVKSVWNIGFGFAIRSGDVVRLQAKEAAACHASVTAALRDRIYHGPMRRGMAFKCRLRRVHRDNPLARQQAREF